MKTLGVYLVFNGNCKEAFTFYRSIFEAEVSYTHYGDFPSEGSEANEDKDRVMNASLVINENCTLMGCDPPTRMGETKIGENFHVVLNTSSKVESNKLFNALADEGSINMPMADQFWGAYFGMVIDKFGIFWMINYTKN